MAGLLNQAQLAALNDRKWASLAGALAEAGMPSRLPIPIGSAIGQAAKAWSGAGDEGALKVLQIQKLAAEAGSLQELAKIRKAMPDYMKGIFDKVTAYNAGGMPGGGPLATTVGGGAPVTGPGGGGPVGGGGGGLPNLGPGNPGSLAMAASPEVQEQVAQKIATTSGLQHWAGIDPAWGGRSVPRSGRVLRRLVYRFLDR